MPAYTEDHLIPHSAITLEQFRGVLNQVPEHVIPPKPQTIFSLGGRGYYENPTSDLLAFFLRPHEEHGLGGLFLEAFLRCIPGAGSLVSPRDHVRVSREKETCNRKRIDLTICGLGWMILIENKIHHGQNNPFDDYEAHFTVENGGKTPLMVVLSPQGKSISPKWNSVSYRDFCRELRNGFQSFRVDGTPSRWRVFAEEFILHLESELYTMEMEPNTVNFVEKNWLAISQAKRLLDDYRLFLLAHLKGLLLSSIDNSEAQVKDDHWAIRCYGSRWGQANIAWWYHQDQPEKIGLTVYVPDPSEEQKRLGREEFERVGMDPRWEGAWLGWHATSFFESRENAEGEFVRLAGVVDRMFPDGEPPVVAQARASSDSLAVPPFQ